MGKDLEKYLIEIGKTPVLSIEEEIELAKAIQQKGVDCDEMKKLVKCNERFVLSAALKLGQMYDKGDEKNGIFRNPLKAREYYKLAGKRYRYKTEIEDPHEADYFVRGSAEELAAVKTLVDELAQKYGEPENELGLYISMNILMKTLVGSHYYDGNLLTMNTDDPECIVLHAEANRMEPLLYALRQAFPYLEIEVKGTQLR
jgi:TPR repeat protein